MWGQFFAESWLGFVGESSIDLGKKRVAKLTSLTILSRPYLAKSEGKRIVIPLGSSI